MWWITYKTLKLFNKLKNLSFKHITGNVLAYNPSVVQLELKIGDKVGLYASSHGNIIAMKVITEYLKNAGVKCIFHLGDIMDEHAGYIECLEYILTDPMIYPIAGNHDLLIINQDNVHNYENEYLQLAEVAYKKLLDHPELYQKIFYLPAKIETQFFSLVHESVQHPYYAKITKLKKNSTISFNLCKSYLNYFRKI